MYILTIVVWATIGIAPVIDKTIEFPKFESCEEQRIKYNTLYEAELSVGSIEGYQTSCTKKQ